MAHTVLRMMNSDKSWDIYNVDCYNVYNKYSAYGLSNVALIYNGENGDIFYKNPNYTVI